MSAKLDTLRGLIHGTNGKFFTVEFTKKDGSHRVMTARLGVKKHLRGGDSTTAHKPNLVTVFDVTKDQYRCINLETVTAFRCGGVKMEVRS